MVQLLYVKANPKAEQHSNSLSVGRRLVDAYRSSHADARIDEIDVYEQDIPLIGRDFLTARMKTAAGAEPADLLPAEQRSVGRIHRFTDQFIAADIYVFAYPLWNLGIPPLLKAYVDMIKMARKTFRYTPEGPVGLLRNKAAVLIQSSGDVYSYGPLKEFEHGSRYLKSVLSFIGVERIESILMEGMDKGETATAAKEAAFRRADQLALAL